MKVIVVQERYYLGGNVVQVCPATPDNFQEISEQYDDDYKIEIHEVKDVQDM